MTKKIFRSILVAVLSVVVLSFLVVTVVLYNHFADYGREQLNNELSLAVQGVKMNGEEYLKELNSHDYRITLVSKNGDVLYDTMADASSMDNHASREEIKEAIATGYGESQRYSDTLTERTLYSAERLPDGRVLRISLSVDTVFALLIDILIPIVTVLIFAILLSVKFAHAMSRAIVKPLYELDLDNPGENDVYDELSQILGKIRKQGRLIARNLEEIRQRADEFEQITASMSEAMVLINKKGQILSMNAAAKRLFLTESGYMHKDFLTIDRSLRMSRAVNDALNGKHSEFREQRNGCEYQFSVGGIEFDGKIIGAAILCFDVTEAAFAERNRQEFTANVSHELKTPLQSIIGSAELLESGLVKAEDQGRFVGHIRTEATRLVSLINDIIRLSQLDENSEAVNESVDLYELASEVIGQLSDSAEKRSVTVRLKGERVTLNGVKRYLYEIIYNLLDNAIRYNVEGGRVTVSIKSDNANTVLTVSDTGIGIPIEHKGRIFERFYRVDKSHSKETGGTGLGLSIVKHAVAYHGGRIELESTEGKGTTVKVIF